MSRTSFTIGQLLGISFSDDAASIVAAPDLCNSAGTLFGGAQLATALHAVARVSEALPVAAHIEFLKPIKLKIICHCSAQPDVRGRSIGHWSANGLVHGETAFTTRIVTCAATGPHDFSVSPRDGLRAVSSKPVRELWSSTEGIKGHFEWRDAIETVAADPQTFAMWLRIPGFRIADAAGAALFVDWVPSACHLLRPGVIRGTTLALDFRYAGAECTSEWIKMEFDIDFIANSVASGRVRLFDEAGTFIAASSQIFRPLR